MVRYATDELISSSQMAKKFGSYLEMIKDRSVEKFAILKNNRVEAVIVSKDEFEKMSNALKTIEASQILTSLSQGLNDIKDKNYEPIEKLWDKL